jgi:hypothetical protein
MSFVATILWLVMKEGAKLCAAGIAIGDRRSARHRAIAVQRAPWRHVRRSGHLRWRRAPGRRCSVVGLRRSHPTRTPSRCAHRGARSVTQSRLHHEAQPIAVLATQDIEPERPPHQLGPFICARLDRSEPLPRSSASTAGSTFEVSAHTPPPRARLATLGAGPGPGSPRPPRQHGQPLQQLQRTEAQCVVMCPAAPTTAPTSPETA